MFIDADFEVLTETLNFLSGSSMGDSEDFNIVIINDVVVEEFIETFTVGLSPGARVFVSGIESASILIMEDLTDGKTVFPDMYTFIVGNLLHLSRSTR